MGFGFAQPTFTQRPVISRPPKLPPTAFCPPSRRANPPSPILITRISSLSPSLLLATPHLTSKGASSAVAAPAMSAADSVGSLLADIANLIADAIRILTVSDKRHWGPDEHEHRRALDAVLDEARKDFQELSPLLNGQQNYELD